MQGRFAQNAVLKHGGSAQHWGQGATACPRGSGQLSPPPLHPTPPLRAALQAPFLQGTRAQALRSACGRGNEEKGSRGPALGSTLRGGSGSGEHSSLPSGKRRPGSGDCGQTLRLAEGTHFPLATQQPSHCLQGTAPDSCIGSPLSTPRPRGRE